MIKIISQNKKYSLILMLIIFSFSLLVGLELLLRIIGYGKHFEFVVQSNDINRIDKVSLNSQYIAIHYFDHLDVRLSRLFKKDPWFIETEFFKNKSKDTYRIFFLGASTTRGFPFIGRRISFPSLFREIIKDVLPEKKFEIINAGYDTLSSFGVLDIFSEIIKYQPDLIIVYSGHNEFIGHFGVNSKTHIGNYRWLIRRLIALQKSRLFLFNKRLILGIKSISSPVGFNNINLFKAMLKKEQVTWSSKEHKIAENQFKKNLLEMARKAKRNGVQLVFSTLASNLKDFRPIRSEFLSNIDIEQRKDVFHFINMGNEALRNKNLLDSVKFYKKALLIDPQYAEIHYLLGKAYLKIKMYEQAKERFEFAREYDKVHLRGCKKFNQIIVKVGKMEDVLVVNIEGQLEKASINNLIGSNFFLEHVHPNVNGHIIIANAFISYLAKQDLIAPNTDWRWERLGSAEDYVEKIGFDLNQYLNSRYTVGRLLLDFPFYHCKQGSRYLKDVKKINSELQLIKECKKVRNGELDFL